MKQQEVYDAVAEEGGGYIGASTSMQCSHAIFRSLRSEGRLSGAKQCVEGPKPRARRSNNEARGTERGSVVISLESASAYFKHFFRTTHVCAVYPR